MCIKGIMAITEYNFSIIQCRVSYLSMFPYRVCLEKFPRMQSKPVQALIGVLRSCLWDCCAWRMVCCKRE